MISPDQFGYHTDDYYRAYYARNEFDVIVLCYDHGKEKIDLVGVTVHYIPYYNKKRFRNELNLYFEIKRLIPIEKIEIVITRFFLLCFSYKLLLEKRLKWILDIRTGAVSSNAKKRWIYNSLLRISTKFYKNISIISESLAKELKLKDYSVIPLGGKALVNKDNVIDSITELNFIYVGVFDDRNLDIVLQAFCTFYRAYFPVVSTKLTIVGYANSENEERKIVEIIQANKDVPINFVGRVPNNRLEKYFMMSNIGISFVPITPWFNLQPPTKTFEYVVNGMVCLATETYENKLVIKSNNGVLVQDNEASVLEGMIKVFELRDSFSRKKIMDQSRIYTWESVYKHTLSKLLS